MPITLGPWTAPRQALTEQPRWLRFGVFEMDLRSGELRRSGGLIKLAPQPFALLGLVARRPGEVVTREEIRQELWGDGTIVDFDQRLNACVNQIRQALADDADNPRFLETLPRRGYRWLPPVETLAGPAPVPGTATPVREASNRRRRMVHTAFTALAVLTAGYLAVSRPRLAVAPVWQRLSFQRGSVSAARFGSGSDVLLSAAWGGDSLRLYSARLGAPDPQPLAGESGELVRASPRGELAYLVGELGPNRRMVRASVSGGPAKELAAGISAGDWNPTNDEVVVAHFVSGTTWIEWPLGKRLLSVPNPSHLRLSPDGGEVALVEHPLPGDDRGSVSLVDRSGARRGLTGEWASIEGLAWSRDGAELWFTASKTGDEWGVFAVDRAGRLRTVLTSADPLYLHDVGRDGRALVDRTSLRQEVALASDGVPERNLSWLDMTCVNDLSPDGQWLLLNETGQGGGPDYSIYLRRSDGAPPVRLSEGTGMALSPDGRYVLARHVGARDHLELIPTGAGARRILRDPGIAAYEWALFFPDGQRLLFVGQDGSGKSRLYVRDIDVGVARAISPEGVKVQKFSPISPDGKQVAARCPQGGYCLYPTDGGEYKQIPGMDGVRPVYWESPTTLVVRERRFSPPVALYRLEVATGKRKPFRVIQPSDPTGVFAISGTVATRDGRVVAYDYFRRLSELYVVSGLR